MRRPCPYHNTTSRRDFLKKSLGSITSFLGLSFFSPAKLWAAAPRKNDVCRIISSYAMLLDAPTQSGEILSQLLFGEAFILEKNEGSYSFGQCAHDGYKGYIVTSSLSDAKTSVPTHRIKVRSTFLYAEPTIKTRPLKLLSLGSHCCIDRIEGNFAHLAEEKGFVWKEHITPLDKYVQDYTKTAELFLHTPYQWGGRGFEGIDCSGLVQISAQSAGISLPRDTKDQVKGAQPLQSLSLQRGDLVFWQGHVGIMRDDKNMLHASGGEMMVVTEAFFTYFQKQKEAGRPFLGVRRVLN